MYSKKEQAEKNREFYSMVSRKYRAEIADCVRGSVVWEGVKSAPLDCVEGECKVVPLDTVSAIFAEAEGRTAVLNFASFKHPGGGFLNGAKAQEEALCGSSFLCNVLDCFPEFYEENGRVLNRGLYADRGIYTPGVLFFSEEGSVKADVITCAAPNYSVGLKYGSVSAEENSRSLDSRIRFVLGMAAANSVDTLVLGAFGCGVFKQNPEEVARVFKKWLDSDYRCFRKVVFAVPDFGGVSSKNYRAFKSVFG